MSSGYLPSPQVGEALGLLQQGDHLAGLVRGPVGGRVGLDVGMGLDQALALVEQARQLFHQVVWTGGGGEHDGSAARYQQLQVLNTPGASVYLNQAEPPELRLTRDRGEWNCLALNFRPTGGCLLDLDGETYVIQADGQILNAAAQDDRFAQLAEKLDRVDQASPPVRVSGPSADWETMAHSVLGQGGAWLSTLAAVTAAATATGAASTSQSPRLRATPEIPILLQGIPESLRLRVEVEGQSNAEAWTLDPPQPDQGDAQAVRLLGCQPLSPTCFELTFATAQEQRCAQAGWILRARQASGVETPPLHLRLLAARPGLQWLSPTPLRVPAEGHGHSELKVTCWRWNPRTAGVEVDAEALPGLQFQVQPGQRALEAAELDFEFQECRGHGPGRYAVYQVKSRCPVPGLGLCLGRVVAQADSLDLTLELALELDQVSLQPNLSLDQEVDLFEEVLQRYLQGALRQRWSEELERDRSCLGANDVRERRKSILKSAVLSWQAVGAGYLRDAAFQARLMERADTAAWVASVAFGPCLRAGLSWAASSQAIHPDSQALERMRTSVSRLVEGYRKGVAVSTTWKSMEAEWWSSQGQFDWPPSCSQLPPQVQETLVCLFILSRFVHQCSPSVDWWRASQQAALELAGPKVGEAFEFFLAGCPGHPLAAPADPHLDSHGIPRLKLF